MVELFGGMITQTLHEVRIVNFNRKVSKGKSLVTPENLPPTPSSTIYHSYRAYYQVMVWMGIGGLNPTEWGWRCENSRLIPSMTDVPPAPDSLLKMIHCNCTTGCETARCTCKRYGLPCLVCVVLAKKRFVTIVLRR